MATSPAAVTIGAATLSRSQRRCAHCDATPIVIASTTSDDSSAPTTATTMKSTIEIDRHVERDRDGLGEHRERERRREREHQRGGDVLTDRRVEPARDAERAGVDEGAEPAAERRTRCPACRSPPGSGRRAPGSSRSVWLIDASVSPATRSPPDEIRSAPKPARTPDGSARTSAPKRAARRRGKRSIGDSAVQTCRTISLERPARVPLLSADEWQA